MLHNRLVLKPHCLAQPPSCLAWRASTPGMGALRVALRSVSPSQPWQWQPPWLALGEGGVAKCHGTSLFPQPGLTECTSAHLSLARPDPRTSPNSKEAGRSVLHVLRTQHLGGELVNVQRLGCVGWGRGSSPLAFSATRPGVH